MYEKEENQDVIILGLLPQSRGPSRLDLLWWVISHCAAAGDLLIVLILCDCKENPHSSQLAGDEGEESVDHSSVSFQTWALGKRRKRIVKQLTQLKHLCKQHRIEMDMKFVGGESPEKVLVQQSIRFQASVLLILTSESFVSWRRWKRKRSKYLVQHVPTECSVIIVRNSRIFECPKHKHQHDDLDDHTAKPASQDSDSLSDEYIQNCRASMTCVPELLDGRMNQHVERDLDGKTEDLSLSETGKVHFSIHEDVETCHNHFDPERGELHISNQTANSSIQEDHKVLTQHSEDLSLPEIIQVSFNVHDKVKKLERSSALEIDDHPSLLHRKGDSFCEDMKVFLHEQDPSMPEFVQVYFEVDEDAETTLQSSIERQNGTSTTHLQGCQQNSSLFKLQDSNFDTNETEEKDVRGEDNNETSGIVENARKSHEETENRSPRSVLDAVGLAVDSTANHDFSNDETWVSPCCSENEDLAHGFRWRKLLGMWKQRHMTRVASYPPAGASRLSDNNNVVDQKLFKRSNSYDPDPETQSHCRNIWGLDKSLAASCKKPSWRCFTLGELESATCNFSQDMLIGRGGYAEVYKGVLPEGEIIAIKKVNKSKTEEQRIRDFLTELGIIAHIDHPHAAHLVGFSTDGGLHIVLQFSPHGSLESMLNGTNSKFLDWNNRYRIAIGIAKGLHYLHESCQRRIIHRDIKSSNILFTEELEPQIADFGLAKWLPKHCTHLTLTPVEGTFGYLAPECVMHGIVNEKTDIFALGVLLLELITGRPPIDSSGSSLVMWASSLIAKGNVEELADSKLENEYDVDQMIRLVMTAGLCISKSAHLRPSMAEVLEFLAGEKENLERALRPSKPISPTVCSESTEKDECSSSTYLKDLDRHKEVALEV